MLPALVGRAPARECAELAALGRDHDYERSTVSSLSIHSRSGWPSPAATARIVFGSLGSDGDGHYLIGVCWPGFDFRKAKEAVDGQVVSVDVHGRGRAADIVQIDYYCADWSFSRATRS